LGLLSIIYRREKTEFEFKGGVVAIFCDKMRAGIAPEITGSGIETDISNILTRQADVLGRIFKKKYAGRCLESRKGVIWIILWCGGSWAGNQRQI